MKYADQFWQDAVMAEMRYKDSGGLASPPSKADLYSRVAREIKLPEWARQDCINRAVRQLKAAGKIEYYFDWQGWQVPDFDHLHASERAARNRQWDAERAERQAAHEAYMDESNTRWGIKPKSNGRFADLAEKMEAKAAATDFPAEAASFRAKAAEYRARGD